MSEKDFYTILGVPENASQDEIKKAYRRLAHEHHPDRKGGSETKFKEINTAYQTLSDPEKRNRYDAMRRYGGQAFGGIPGFDFSFDFGGGRLGSFEDLLQQFFGGLRTQTRTRPQTRVSTGFTIRGPNGTSVYLEVTGSRPLDQETRAKIEAAAKKILELLQ